MKRFILRCAALLSLVLFLAACAPKQAPAPENPVQSPPAESTRAALPFSVGSLYELDWADCTSGVNDGKAFYKLELIPSTENAVDSPERGYSYRILRIDYETRVQAPLCSLPGCTHQSADCPAYIGGGMYWEYFTLSVVEGQLYLLHTFREEMLEEHRSTATQEQTFVWLDKVAMDGSGRRRAAELPAGWMLDSDGFPVTDGAALYGQYADLSDYSMHGVRVALETGEATAFSFGLDDSEQLLGAWDGQFVLRRSDNGILQTAYPGVMTPEQSEVFQSMFGSLSPRSLLLYDPTAGTRTDLSNAFLQTGLSSIPYYVFLQQGKFYYITTDEAYLPQAVWQIDLAGRTARILAEFAPPLDYAWRTLSALRLFPAGSGQLEPYVEGYFWSGQNESFLVDVRDGSVLEIGLRYPDPHNPNETYASHPLAQTDSGLWLVPAGYRTSSIDPDHMIYALAAPETVITGVGEVYPIEMWSDPAQALG